MSEIELSELAKKNETARAFFEHLAAREKNYSVTTVARAAQIIGADKREVAAVFKKLQEMGYGRYVSSKGGATARFEWSVSMIDVGRAGLDQESSIATLNEEEGIELEEEENGFIDHAFHLRVGEDPIVISLPEDLTKEEARRLSRFISCLPFESSQDDDFDF